MSDRRHVVGFLVAGILATTGDAVAYAALLTIGWTHDPAKAASFVVGALISFTLNRRFTFRSQGALHREAVAFSALYAVTFLLNVGVNHVGVALLVPSLDHLGSSLAFLAATAASTVANFLGQRLWVFTPSRPPP